ncbi:MAG TPA: glycosyltransferase [Phycisphaerae bacterium]|nr:glycosyltransferase [Phycisphaerae bacterium]
MSNFAAVILACNEQEVLPRCLDSIADVAELYVSVDENSTDQTEAIARQYTPHVFAHNLAAADGGWAEVRNALQEEAEKQSAQDWFLWLDPDEWLAEGKAGLVSLFAQAGAMEPPRTGLMVRMVDIPAGAEPGIRGASWQNCKFFRRGQRFARRRHEHLPVGEPRAECPQVAIHHQKLQRPEVQDACLKYKTNLAALEADWTDWQDMRAAYYIGDAVLQGGDAETAVLWFERGLTLPDTIAGAQSQLYAGLFAAHRKLGHYEAAKRAAHCRWACDWRDGRDCAWQLGSLATDHEQLDEAESWFNTVLTMPETEPGLNQVLASSPVELSHYGLAVVAGKRGDLTGMHRHLRAAEQFGPRSEYAILRGQLVKAVS